MPLSAGDRLGAYQIIGKLGAGAMGEVYKARDTRLERDVALKILPAEFANNPDRRRRFELESRAASALNHPNIVAVYDAGDDQGYAYIVSEFVDGESLRDVVSRGPMPVRRVVEIGSQLADGLAAAHAAGVVHRDMKPENVVLTRDGRPKILDFGLARYQPTTPQSSGTATMTQAGMIMGTAGYMSPEQVTGTPADARSDIFSLGIIIYEMLAGKPAFEASTTVETMTAILRNDAPELPAGTPELLQQVVDHCLEKEPARRYQSAKDLAFSLNAYAGRQSSAGSSAATTAAMLRKPRRILPFVTVGLGVLAAAAIAALFLRKPGADLGAYQFTPFAAEAEQQGTPAWSPDGKNVAYQRIINNASNIILVRSLDSPLPNQIAKVNSTHDIFWSADSGTVYFAGENAIWSVGRTGGTKQQILKGPYETASLSPDGKSMVLWYGSDGTKEEKAKIQVSSPPGSQPREYQPVLFKGAGTFSPTYLRFSPDGQKILLARFRGKDGAELWLLPFPDGPQARFKARQIFGRTFAGAGVPSLSWMPDSRHIVFAKNLNDRSALYIGDTQSEKMEPITADEGGKTDPSVSPDGTRVLYRSIHSDFDLVELSLSGGGVRPILATNRSELFPAWSPKGNQLAYVTDRSGSSEIWMRNGEEGWERPLVTARDFPDDPTTAFLTLAFSPDGSRIAYARSSAKTLGSIWISPVSGGSPIRINNSEHFELGPSWSPDGEWLAYFSSGGGLMKMKVGSSEPAKLISSDGCASPPQWSLDGQLISCSQQEGVTLFSPDGQKVRTLETHMRDNYAIWSRDGKEIYALGRNTEGHWLLTAVDAKSGSVRNISDYGSQVVFASNFNPSFPMTLSPDGKTIAATVYNAKSEIWMMQGYRLPWDWFHRLF